MNRNQWIAVIVLVLLVLVAIGIGVLLWIRKPAVVVTTSPNPVVPALVTGAKRQPVNKARPLNAQTPTYREVTGLKSS